MAEIPPELTHIKPDTLERILLGIVAACEEHSRPGKAVSSDDVRRRARTNNNTAAHVVKLWKAGLSLTSLLRLPATSSPSMPGEALVQGLGDRVRAATSDGEREELALELGGLVADGRIDLDAAQVIRALLGDARASAEKRRENEPPPEDPTRIARASDAGMRAARAVDLMLSDERRERVLAFLAAELEADAAEHPNVDRGGVA